MRADMERYKLLEAGRAVQRAALPAEGSLSQCQELGVDLFVDRSFAPAAPALQGFLPFSASDHPHT
jgi:hypothetical protein